MNKAQRTTINDVVVRLNNAIALLSDAGDDVPTTLLTSTRNSAAYCQSLLETIRDDEQEKADSVPEHLAEKFTEAADSLENAVDLLSGIPDMTDSDEIMEAMEQAIDAAEEVL